MKYKIVNDNSLNFENIENSTNFLIIILILVIISAVFMCYKGVNNFKFIYILGIGTLFIYLIYNLI